MMVWLLLNLFIIIIFILLYLIIKKSDKNWSKLNDYLGMVSNAINSVRYGNLATKIVHSDLPSSQSLSESINRMIETLNDREKMIIEYQNELTRQNRFLEAVINSLSDGILVIDENHTISITTPKIAEWFAKDGKDLLGKDLKDFIVVMKNTKIEKLKQNDIVIKTFPESNFLASTMKLSLDDKKRRYVVIIKDVTKEKEVEKLREDFVATLTHDLKVPIVAESNMLEFLYNGKFGDINDRQQHAISSMKASNSELLELVQVLLETYQIKEKGIDLNKVELSVAPFIAEIVEEMRPIAEKTHLTINYYPETQASIIADEVHLKRVVKNLINNAISHSESDKQIDVKITNDSDLVKICIIDYGKGISKEDIDKIFNKYYSAAKKFRKIGTGLGLYLSQQIVKSHAGEITVTSEENVSTVFCINLPVKS